MQSETNNRYRFVIQSLVILVRSCIGLIWASAGPLLPLIMKEYGINRGSAAWFASAAPITIAVSAIPLSIFLSKISLKKAFAIGGFLQAAGLFAPLCGTYFPLILTRVVFALGTAVTVPVAMTIASEWFTSRELPLVNGITMSFVNLGNAIAFVSTVPIATFLSWKAPIVAYGAFAFTCATAWIIFGRDKPKAVKTGVKTGILASESDRESGAWQILTQRTTLLLAFAVFGTWCLGNIMGSWLPSYYHEVFKMPLAKASSFAAVITTVGTAACILGGVIPMRLGKRKPFLIIPGALMGLSALAAISFNNPAIILVSIACFGLFSNLQTPSLFTIPMELPNGSSRKAFLVMAAMQTAGNLGNFIGPLIEGYIADVTGSYLPGFYIGATLSLSLLMTGLLIPETGPGAKKS